MAEGSNTAEIMVALVVVVASFMYVYDALTSISHLDVLLAVLAFGGGLVYLFSNIWHK